MVIPVHHQIQLIGITTQLRVIQTPTQVVMEQGQEIIPQKLKAMAVIDQFTQDHKAGNTTSTIVDIKYMFQSNRLVGFIAILLASSSAFAESSQLSSSSSSIERVRSEFKTNEDCKYVEFTRTDLVESRKQMTLNWDGDCKDGYLNGTGTLKINLPNTSEQVIKTYFKNGYEDGDGESVETGPRGKAVFKGKWVNGLKTEGVLETISSTGFGQTKYEGTFINGLFGGKGKLINEKVSVYEGDFKDGKKNGKGKITFTNGSYYEGEYVNDKMSGAGYYWYGSDRYKQGQFENNALNGRGKYQTSTVLYEGIFKLSLIHI